MRHFGIWNKNFAFLFVSRVLKEIAGNFASIAFVWLLIENGGGPLSTSILFFCALIPEILLTAFVSPLLSKGKLHYWMFASDLARAFILLIVPVLYILQLLPVWLFYVSALLQSISGTIYSPASVALLPKIIEQERIQSSNALLQSSAQVVALLGLAGAGAMVSLLSAQLTLIVTSCLFICSAIFLLFIKPAHEEQNGMISPSKGTISNYFEKIGAGFKVVRQHPLIFSLTIFAIFLNLGMAPFLSLSPVFVAEELDGNAAILTFIRISNAMGAILMGIILAKVKIQRQGFLFNAAGIGLGVALITMGLSGDLGIALLCCFLLGMCMTGINVPEMVIVQTTISQAQQAQVFSTLTTISLSLLPFGIILSGTLAEWLGPGFMILLGGVLITISGILVYFFSPLPKLQTETKQEVPDGSGVDV